MMTGKPEKRNEKAESNRKEGKCMRISLRY